MTAAKIIIFGAAVAAVLAASAMSSIAPRAAPISYKLPDETAEFAPGPNLETTQLNCTACHSADYIKTQPRGAKFKADFWRAEVTKMINSYGAPIPNGDVDKIVDYLTQTY
jgi:hypothetical protein